MHEGQAKIALLKNQSHEAEVALAGFIWVLNRFDCFDSETASAMENEVAVESSKCAALQQCNVDLKRRCAEAQAIKQCLYWNLVLIF
jgi:hypothetical protein